MCVLIRHPHGITDTKPKLLALILNRAQAVLYMLWNCFEELICRHRAIKVHIVKILKRNLKLIKQNGTKDFA